MKTWLGMLHLSQSGDISPVALSDTVFARIWHGARIVYAVLIMKYFDPVHIQIEPYHNCLGQGSVFSPSARIAMTEESGTSRILGIDITFAAHSAMF